MAPDKHVTWHWICLDDDDLSFILDFDPDRDRTATRADMVDVIREFQELIEDGLETA